VLLALLTLAAALPARAAPEPVPPSQPASQPASGPRRYTLNELLAKAREVYPGIEAGRYSLQAAEAQLSEARRAYIPQGTISTLLAPAPEVKCGLPDDMIAALGITPAQLADKHWRETHCLGTPSLPTPQLVGIKGVLARVDVNLVWPIYTFGKLSSAIDAARAGVSAGHGRIAQARAQVEIQLKQAYYGLKLARELTSTIEEGKEHVDKARKQIEEELDEGKGNATVTDLRRLQVISADIEARKLESERGAALALAAIRVLIPVGLPRDFDIDDEPLARPEAALKPLDEYQRLALSHRPEVKLLDAAVAARRAAVGVQKGTFYPDVLIVGSFSYAYTSSADTPQNSFFNNPLNGIGFGGGLALRLSWDYGLKLARLARVRAELAETGALRRQALGGIGLEVEKSRAELDEAQRRVDATHKGERAAMGWLNNVAQNLGMGLAETRDFSDALLAFFQMRLRYLQALYDAQIAHASLVKAAGAE
jgi:outer membrane protein TolC